MKITVNRLEAPFYLEARNEEGNSLTLDASPDIGGTGRGFRPMQTLLAGLGGCSAIDVVVILQKSRQPLDDIQVEIEGHRQEGVEPSLFETIHVTYKLKGGFTDEAAQRAVDWSMNKYCSVAKTLEKTATITWSWERIE
jgi:putative redox protein